MGLFVALSVAIHLRGELGHPNDAKADVVRLRLSRKATVFSGEHVAMTARSGTAKRKKLPLRGERKKKRRRNR